MISKNCSETVGQVGRAKHKSLGRDGSKCWLGKRPVVRGVVMNLVDHPHGWGEGKKWAMEKAHFFAMISNTSNRKPFPFLLFH